MSLNEQKPEERALDIEPPSEYRGRYDGPSPIKLRIATGGAGQSGLLQALADAFINQLILPSPLSISKGVADVGITYHPLAEIEAKEEGIADRREYAWRDHWMLVGPKSNEAQLKSDDQTTIYTLFTQLYRKAVETRPRKKRVRFLSRYDKSATNIKESSIWAAIGQTPWSFPYTDWYHRNVDFLFRTMEVAALLGEYTLIDRGTWFAVNDSIREKMTVFLEGRDDDKDDVMLNPAHALVGKKGLNYAMANDFVDWMIKDDGGQAIIGAFAMKGVTLYTKAPAKA